MGVVTFISCLWFAGPLAKLESRSFAERETATAELKDAGVAAWPAIWHGYRTNSNPEASWRLERIVPEIDREALFVAWLRFGDLKVLAEWLAARPGELTRYFGWIDRNGGWQGDSARWARQPPHQGGLFLNDVLHILKTARANLMPKPPPKIMPGYSWNP